MILYAQGYRIDFSPASGRIKITQAGGLFLKVAPKQTNIYINEKLVKRTDFFFGSTLIENLLPKQTNVSAIWVNFSPSARYYTAQVYGDLWDLNRSFIKIFNTEDLLQVGEHLELSHEKWDSQGIWVDDWIIN